MAISDILWDLGREILPLPRSILGKGFRDTLDRIEALVGTIARESYFSGQRVFDWEIPAEWRVREAWIIGPSGDVVCDWENDPLHLVGYSEPFEGELTLEELLPHLHSLPEQPDAIPYVTSYYTPRWGFCLAHEQLAELKSGIYRVCIKAEKFPGELEIGEIFLPGKNPGEVLFSSYLCHPSMANNELSGPLMMAGLISHLRTLNLEHSYRFLFLPETIGSIAYLSRHLESLKRDLRAGWVLTTIGDERNYSFLETRTGNRFVDRFTRKSLSRQGLHFLEYSWIERGSDERQYCAPGVDLPVASLMRTKYGEYPEYHTSLDRFGTVVTKKGLETSLKMLVELVTDLEKEKLPRATQLGEPQLSRRSLFDGVSAVGSYSDEILDMMNILSMSDGDHSIDDLAEYFGFTKEKVDLLVNRLHHLKLVTL